MAERWTASSLRSLRRAQWQILHDVPFEEMNVDHLAFGPRGVVAIETKFTSLRWVVEDNTLRGPYHDPIGQAKLAARKMRLLLKSNGLSVEVRPALVVWDPGSENLTPSSIDGVALLVGRHSREWLRALPHSTDGLSSEQIEKVRVILERFIATREAFEKSQHASRAVLGSILRSSRNLSQRRP